MDVQITIATFNSRLINLFEAALIKYWIVYFSAMSTCLQFYIAQLFCKVIFQPIVKITLCQFALKLFGHKVKHERGKIYSML